MNKVNIKSCMLFSAFFFLAVTTLRAQHLQKVWPEQVGMSSQVLALADSALNAEIQAKEIPGAVLAITRHGKLAYLKAYGNRSVYPKTEKMTTNTIFDMASCSKAISTATCTMILLQEGKIRLMDPVKHYLPEFLNWKDGTNDEETIRIIHLLTHTSGLPSYTSPEPLAKKYGSPNPTALMLCIDSLNRSSAPEVQMRYSCLNYITLQNIIQHVTGKSLKDFARDRIFTPLGMNHTGYQPADSLLPLVAPTTKQPDGSVLRGQVHDPLARIMNGGISGNAGLFASAEDLAVFTTMLLNKGEWNGVRILSPAAVRTLTTIPRGFEQFGRTCGWDISSPYNSNVGDLLSSETFGHTGYTGTSVTVDPANDLSIILLIHAVHPEDKHSVVRLRSVIANIVASSLDNTSRIYTDHYYQRCQKFQSEPALTNKDIVMLGNSLTEGGGDWNKRLGKKHIINRGIIGDEAMGIFDRLEPILNAHPRRIYLMIGINDVSHDATKDSIAGNIRLVIHKIRSRSPQTELYVQSLLPINESFGRYKRLAGKTDFIPQLNQQVEAITKAEGAKYLNLFPLFKEDSGNSLRRELSSDGLHLNNDGYNVWAKALKETL